MNFDNTHRKRRIDGRKEVHLAELPYQVSLNNPYVREVKGRGNGERDPSSPTLPWPCSPALELKEQKRRGTGVVTLRLIERGGLRKVGYTTVASALNPHSGESLALKVKLIRLNSSPKPYPMVVWIRSCPLLVGHPPMQAGPRALWVLCAPTENALVTVHYKGMLRDNSSLQWNADV